MRAWKILGTAAVLAFVAGCEDSVEVSGEPGTDAAPADSQSQNDAGPEGAAGDGSSHEASPDASTEDAAPEGSTQDATPEGSTEDAAPDAAEDAPPDGSGEDQSAPEAGNDASAADAGACKNATQCALADEQKSADKLAALVADPAHTGLFDFLTAVPKGGDLHMHLSGAVYAETYMEWARNETAANITKYCVNTSSLSLSTSCSSGTPVPSPGDALFDQVIRAWSMQDFVPSASETGHDHFFATFGKFGAISGPPHHDECLADAMTRADSENELYLEPMLFSNSTASNEGKTVWTGGTLTTAALPSFHAALLAHSAWPASVQAIINDINNTENGARKILGCDDMSPSSACRVSARYMVYISRSGGGPEVFAQMVAAFEAAKVEPRLVALNLVGPEDGTSALSAYDRQMEMLEYLNTAYAGQSPLHVSLHAGELASKYMPSNYSISTINHIRKAVEVAHAERIGHGVDVLGETNASELIDELSQLGVMVEIGLSSNIQILEVSGTAHPLATYIQNGVPVALVTDDQAVSRSSMAGEYQRAVLDQNLGYKHLKKMARTSLDKSFAPGASLWSDLDTLQSVPECAPTLVKYYGDDPSPACKAFLDASPRATMQWELEKRFRTFESSI